jgi:[acyl-carrier-protein] S-malonyltransferase
MADDCVELGRDTTLGVLFSRGPALDLDAVHWLCLRINSEGHGVIGISSYLSPNTILLLGQGKTVDRFAETMSSLMPKGVHLRKNEYRWPPLHTPIMWERHIPNRAAMQMHAMPGGFKAPKPPVLSLVTGKMSYNDYNAREILIRWIDHPQRLWDGVYETLSQGIDTVVHVGPEPNLVVATFTRVADNVRGQLAERSLGGFGLRAVSRAVRRPWLSKLLPTRTALLRAPFVEQIILEDWLLAQPLSKP